MHALSLSPTRTHMYAVFLVFHQACINMQKACLEARKMASLYAHALYLSPNAEVTFNLIIMFALILP